MKFMTGFSLYYSVTTANLGPRSSVVIATGYGLDGPGSNPGGGEIFRTCPDRPWGPPSLLYNGYRVFPGGKERPVRDADPSPPSSAVGHERVELYLCSPCGPYGLYRASVPVQGRPLPFTATFILPISCMACKLCKTLIYKYKIMGYVFTGLRVDRRKDYLWKLDFRSWGQEFSKNFLPAFEWMVHWWYKDKYWSYGKTAGGNRLAELNFVLLNPLAPEIYV